MFCLDGGSCVYWCLVVLGLFVWGFVNSVGLFPFGVRCLLRDFGCDLDFLLYSCCSVVICCF